jgi:hypothetical protein
MRRTETRLRNREPILSKNKYTLGSLIYLFLTTGKPVQRTGTLAFVKLHATLTLIRCISDLLIEIHSL